MPNFESILNDLSADIWVFGYGSLTWRPDFEYEEKHVGFIEGFARRFWQESTSHRGNKSKPGRVVTLVEEKQSQVWGIAFKIKKQHIEKALGKLNHRECKLGGYEITQESFHSNALSTSIAVLVYIATESNALFVGRESPEKSAKQIVSAHGHCGPNIEYLFRLVDFMNEHAPDAEDDHLFHIDLKVRKMLGLPVDRVIPWDTLVEENMLREEHMLTVCQA